MGVKQASNPIFLRQKLKAQGKCSDRQRLDIHAGFTLFIHVKRQMAAALQDAQGSPIAPEPRESVLDCASPLSPLALSGHWALGIEQCSMPNDRKPEDPKRFAYITVVSFM
jgi:hypothetical protein